MVTGKGIIFICSTVKRKKKYLQTIFSVSILPASNFLTLIFDQKESNIESIVTFSRVEIDDLTLISKDQ